MAQIVMICGTTVTTTEGVVAATTGGPFRLPPWAPDIEWATTSENVDWPVLISSTSPDGPTTNCIETVNVISSYTKRTFGLTGNCQARKVMLTYRAAGELVRT